MIITRRQFGSLAGASLGAGLTRSLWAAEGNHPNNERFFHFAVVADPHIIDDFYHGHESNDFDTESLRHSAANLTSARDLINSLNPRIEQVFLVGDYFHNYPSPDYDFYFKNTTRLDNAKAISDGFHMPVHVGFGNHDYGVPDVSRETSHRLFEAKFSTQPYYAIEHRSYKFVHLNNFLGSTWGPASTASSRNQGSLGQQQLNWFEAQMQERKPTFIFIHYPLYICQPTEVADYGLHPLLRKYQDNIQLVVSGHWHKWIDFARTFGPPHYVMAATRYDSNAYMLIEVDSRHKTWRFMNSSLVEWSTHYSKPYSSTSVG
jgi:3',5'-cyclic-AMP phosphodiesterase